jgi:hypothetical protein
MKAKRRQPDQFAPVKADLFSLTRLAVGLLAEHAAPAGYEYAAVVIHVRDGTPDVVVPVLPASR